MKEEVKYFGIIITVTNDHTPNRTWSTFFSNAPGFFYPLQHVKHLRGFTNKDAAIGAGKEFVDKHQWEPVGKDKTSLFDISIRLWWDGSWEYSIKYFTLEYKGTAETREGALTAAHERAGKEAEDLQ